MCAIMEVCLDGKAIFNIHQNAKAMMAKRFTKNKLVKAIFGCLFGIMGMFVGLMATPVNQVYADPVDDETATQEYVDDEYIEDEESAETEEELVDDENAVETAAKDTEKDSSTRKQTSCERSLESVGWLVCPTTGKIAEAVDWLYDKIETILVINPVEMKDGSPIYEIWKYMRGITNVVFIIFLLVVIYSQLTGVGISNYGVKKVLPKLIIAAMLVNLSFVICSLAVDVSNVVGSSLRGVFTSIEESTIGAMTIENGQSMYVPMTEVYSSLAGGTMLAVGAGAVAFEAGAIWMLIPIVLGAIVAVVTGLITIALRQAVVALLIMVAPLAMVAYMLPNTEEWFKKWKKLLIRMLVFYPVFSLLFGASSLAGFAIIVSASDGFWVLVGIAVQIFPLFFAWSLMKMSGTILGTINTKIRGLAARPLASTRSWAELHREATRMKYLASDNVYTPSLYLRQYLSDRKIHREEEMKENAEIVKNRGLAYSTDTNYDKKGKINREGERAYRNQARNMQYQRVVLRHKNNFNEGLSKYYAGNAAQKARLDELDKMNMDASDYLKMETARGELVDYRNAMGFHERMEDAMNAHMDELHWDTRDKDGKLIYERHFASRVGDDFLTARSRYNTAKEIMNDNLQDAQYAAAFASHAYDTQAKIISTKFQKYFELAPPTRDVRYRLEEFSQFAKKLEDGTFSAKAVDNIDAIISGLRILNQRGDTDFLKNIMDDILDEKYGGLELGTHASQALASFLMFEVKDNDPYLRRFGKYINLETARRFDENKRQKETVDYDEYVKGYHMEPDGSKMFAKKDMAKLMEGTSLDGIERTALDNYDASLRKAYTDENGVLDVEAYEKRRKEIDKATAPQFISANLKYLSGSEQITSAVKSKTGFMAKQNKETGKYEMVAIWNDKDEADKLFKKYENDPEKWNEAKDNLEKFYREQTLQYLQDQTPAQILGLRSDYKEPLLEHLSAAYLLDKNGEVDEEKLREHNEAIDRIDNDSFGETDPEEIAKMRKKAKEKLQMQEAGETFRELLYKKGKLEQIEKSKRSGAANNAKDWVRELLLLDSKDELSKWILARDQVEKKNVGVEGDVESQKKTVSPETTTTPEVVRDRQRQQKIEQQKALQEQQMKKELLKKMLKDLEEQQKKQADANLTPAPQKVSAYSVDDVNKFKTYVENLWYEVRDRSFESEEYDNFYNESHDFAVETLGAESYVVKSYEKYYEDNPTGDSYDMREYLIGLLKTLLDD